ncbi:hypothetical protein KSP39_PZI010295 [Platanthera zijinensis]|uniref:Uncharacterized protein n=1 Tax=Platanthera zijinensis TaxID=2320716 RepID=A0AAP0BIM4_9ASPA
MPSLRPMISGDVGCFIFLRRPPSHPYHALVEEVGGDAPPPAATSAAVRVVVGKERREFLVDPFLLQREPFRVLMDMASNGRGFNGDKNAVFVDVDCILFEHLLWSVYNDFSSGSNSSSSLFRLCLKEIIEFYSQDL